MRRNSGNGSTDQKKGIMVLMRNEFKSFNVTGRGPCLETYLRYCGKFLVDESPSIRTYWIH